MSYETAVNLALAVIREAGVPEPSPLAKGHAISLYDAERAIKEAERLFDAEQPKIIRKAGHRPGQFLSHKARRNMGG